MRPRADNEVLIFFASSALRSKEFITPVFVILSLPARSAKMNLEFFTLPPVFYLSFNVITQWDRLDLSFRLCDFAVLVASIVCIIFVMSSDAPISISFVPLISYSYFLATAFD